MVSASETKRRIARSKRATAIKKKLVSSGVSQSEATRQANVSTGAVTPRSSGGGGGGSSKSVKTREGLSVTGTEGIDRLRRGEVGETTPLKPKAVVPFRTGEQALSQFKKDQPAEPIVKRKGGRSTSRVREVTPEETQARRRLEQEKEKVFLRQESRNGKRVNVFRQGDTLIKEQETTGLQRVGETFKQIGGNLAESDRSFREAVNPFAKRTLKERGEALKRSGSAFIRPVGVSERFQGTLVGDVGTFVSSPAGIVAGTAGIASGAGVVGGTARSIFVGQSTLRGTQALQKTTEEEKAFLKTRRAREGVAQARQAEAEFVASKSINVPGTSFGVNPRGIAFELTGFAGSSKEFKQSLQQQGFSAREVGLLSRQREFTNVGEAASFLAISAKTEIVGRGAISANLGRQGVKGLSTTAAKQKVRSAISKPLLVGGFTEGFSQEIVQQSARQSGTDIGQAATEGAIGAASARIIGGIIGTKSVGTLGERKVGRAVEFAANIADPFEKPGDILADVAQGSARRITGFRSAPTGVFSTTIPEGESGTISVRSDIMIPTTTRSTTKGSTTTSVRSRPNIGVKTTIGGTQTQTFVKDPDNSFVAPVLTPTPTPTNVLSSRTKGRSRTLINLPVEPISPVPTDVPVPVPVEPIVPVPSQVPTEVPAQINTFTETNVLEPSFNINVPVVTPNVRLPVVPIIGGGGGGGFSFGTRKRKKKKRATRSVFQSIFGLQGVGVVQNGGSEQTGLFLRQ